MTNEELLTLAKQAGLGGERIYDWVYTHYSVRPETAYRQAFHTDITPEILRFGQLVYEKAWADTALAATHTITDAAIAKEREACAKLAEQTVCDTHLPTGVKIYGTRVAQAIRARSAL